MYFEKNIKHFELPDNCTVKDVIDALSQLPLDEKVDNISEIDYSIWSNEDSDRVRQGYKEYKRVYIN